MSCSDELFCDEELLAAGQTEKGIKHLLRMPEEMNQMLSPWAIGAGQPLFDGPLVGASPFHDNFDCLMGIT
jgi:hypothetical protein